MIFLTPQVFTVFKEMTRLSEMKANVFPSPKSRDNMNENVKVVGTQWGGEWKPLCGSPIYQVWIIFSLIFLRQQCIENALQGLVEEKFWSM